MVELSFYKNNGCEKKLLRKISAEEYISLRIKFFHDKRFLSMIRNRIYDPEVVYEWFELPYTPLLIGPYTFEYRNIDIMRNSCNKK